VRNPSVRLLSNGEEEGKGNQLMINASHMLVDTPGINFLGNVESKDVFKGMVDVVVTDGFTGNIFLKTAESASRLLQDVMGEEIRRRPNSMVGGLMIKGALKRVKARMDDSEYGGAVLLGLSGIVVVAHGKSKANAVQNAIRVAKQGVESDLPAKIEMAVAQDKVHAPLVAAVA